MSYIKQIFPILWLSFIASFTFGQSPAVVADGKFTEPAWGNATVLMESDSLRVVYFQTQHELIIGVVAKGSVARYVDMYIKSNSNLHNLHASFQAGERLLPDTGFTDDKPAWKWGNNTNWKVNTVAYCKNPHEKLPFRQQLEPYEGYEFIIEKSKLAKGKAMLRVELKGFEEGIAPVVYPVNSEKYLQKKWKKINIR